MVAGIQSRRSRRGVIYTRVSDPHLAKSDKTSLADQEASARRLAEDEGIGVAQVYVDPGVTGTIMERPAFQQMLRDMRKGGFDVIISDKVDRFSREPVIQHWVQVEAQMYGVELLFVEMEGRNLQPREKRIIETIKGLKAIMEVDDTKDRTQRGRRRRAERGWLMTSRWPHYGYRWKDDVKGQRRYYELHVATSAHVRRIFEEVASGKPLKRIILDLNADGVPTRQRAALLDGRPVPARGTAGKAAYAWTRQAIAEIVRNPSYMGAHRLYGTTSAYRSEVDPRTGEPYRVREQRPRDAADPLYHEVGIPAIVERDLWRAANDRLDRNRHESPRSRQDHTDALLRAGHVICGHCQTSMVVVRRKEGAAYYCRRRHAMRHVVGTVCPVPCNSKSARKLDAAVWAELAGTLQEPDVLERMLARALALSAEGRGDAVAHLASLDEALRMAQGSLAGLVEQSMQPNMPEVAREAVSAKLREVGELIEGLNLRRGALVARRERQDLALARARGGGLGPRGGPARRRVRLLPEADAAARAGRARRGLRGARAGRPDAGRAPLGAAHRLRWPERPRAARGRWGRGGRRVRRVRRVGPRPGRGGSRRGRQLRQVVLVGPEIGQRRVGIRPAQQVARRRLALAQRVVVMLQAHAQRRGPRRLVGPACHVAGGEDAGDVRLAEAIHDHAVPRRDP